MKLDRLVVCALAMTAALACGCSSTSNVPARTASAAPLSAEAVSMAGTTNLMSAHLAGPAPRVGKSHLTELDSEGGGANDASESAELDAPKEARRSDGSRRGGGFGSSK